MAGWVVLVGVGAIVGVSVGMLVRVAVAIRVTVGVCVRVHVVVVGTSDGVGGMRCATKSRKAFSTPA